MKKLSTTYLMKFKRVETFKRLKNKFFRKPYRKRDREMIGQPHPKEMDLLYSLFVTPWPATAAFFHHVCDFLDQHSLCVFRLERQFKMFADGFQCFNIEF